MPVVRVHPRKQFTQTPNDAIRGMALSPNALALLVLLLSFPDDWEFSLSWLRKTHIKLSKKKMAEAFQELQDKGYAKREQSRGKGNRIIGYDYIIFTEPQQGAN